MSTEKKEGKGRWALITGASAGIGEAFVHVFARNGYNIVLVARRKDKLNAIAEKVAQQYRVETLVITSDLGKPKAPQQIYDKLQKKEIRISALVNNAGYAIKTNFADTPWETHRALIQVMMTAVTELSYLFAQDMKAQQFGRIINVSSLAAFAPQMAGNLYNGVKSYVACLSEALHFELSQDGVHCTALCPGLTKSEFHDVMEVRDLANKAPGFMWTSAEQVAENAYQAVEAGQTMCIPGGLNKAVTGLMGLMPMSIKSRAGKLSSLIDIS